VTLFPRPGPLRRRASRVTPRRRASRRAMARRPPRLGLGLDLDASASSLRTSMSTDLGASYNLTDEGVRLLSASQREFHLNAAGHETRTAAERKRDQGGRHGTTPMDIHERGNQSDVRYGNHSGNQGSGPTKTHDDPPSPVESVANVDILPFDVLGAGAGGAVKRAIHVPLNKFIALKVMTVFDRDKRKQLVNELRALCDAPNEMPGIIGFLGAFYDPEKNTVNVALEYVDGGSLESILKQHVRLSDTATIAAKNRNARIKEKRFTGIPVCVVGDLCSQIASGLEYLHERARLVHRDIKPGNILVKRSGECKITDFGIVAQSKMMEGNASKTGFKERSSFIGNEEDPVNTSNTPKETGNSFKSQHSIALRSFKGSLRYMSPERVERQPYGRAADIWSLGITLCECALGRYPFDETDGGLLGLALKISESNVSSGGASILPKEFIDATDGSSHPKAFVELVSDCVRKAPGDRPTATMVAQNAFIKRCELDSKTHPADWTKNLGAFVRRTVNVTENARAEAEAFVAHYRRLVENAAGSANGRPSQTSAASLKYRKILENLYRAPSCLTSASGRRARGGDAIARVLVEEHVSLMRNQSSERSRTPRKIVSISALPGGVDGGILVSCVGRLEKAGGEQTGTLETFLLLRVHEGWAPAPGGDGTRAAGQFYVRNQVEKWVD